MDFDIFPKTLIELEDCLIANILVPDTNETKIPVVVYVHGGAFVMGYGNMGTYKNLVKSKMLIVVTFNYRLGAHGFLCLGTKDIPGNAGMKDQVALLKWVKKNIASFGGNPDDVTIAGYSAGSASVDLLMLSQSAKGLFNKVIPESGTNTAVFSIQIDPIKNAQEFARLLNFTNGNFNALEEFYKTTSYEIITSGNYLSSDDFTLLMSPCIERKSGEDPFLTDYPVNILKSGNYKKMPVLYGFSNMEGLLWVDLFDEWREDMNNNFTKFLPVDLKFKGSNEKQATADIIKQFYFGKNPINEEQILNYINYFSDVSYVYPTLRSIKLHLEAGHRDVYLYEYSFVHDDDPIIPYTKIRGANHCSQSYAVMDGTNITQHSESSISPDLKHMKQLMRQIWMNFITTGEPVPKGSELPAWPPVGKDGAPHMMLNLPLALEGPLLKERVQFWEEIYSMYYHHPSPPSPPVQRHTEM